MSAGTICDRICFFSMRVILPSDGWPEKVEMFGSSPLYFFSTLTFWLSQERPSKIPVEFVLA